MESRVRLLFILLFISVSALAQDKSGEVRPPNNDVLNLERQIRFKDHSNNETISIEIDNDVNVFFLNVKTKVDGGKLTIEIYDPNQNKEGTFTIGTQLNLSVEELAKGEINKEFYEPQSGTWTIKIIPEKAYGDVIIYSQTSY